MRQRVLSLLLCFVMLVGLVPITAYAAATIDRADILITHPAHLENPDTFAQVYGNCQVDTTYNTDNFKNGLRWREISTGKVMSANDTFVAGNLYELSVLLISKTGYAFSASATTVTINMDPVSLTVLDVNRAKATITLTAENLYINHVTITDLDAPKVGNTPDFSATLQENVCNIYTTSVSSGIAWYDHDRQAYLSETDRFQSGHQYSVGVYVQAKKGYEFPQNVQATINGCACTIGQNNGQMLKAVLEYPTLVEAHTHTPSTWRTTGAYHYKACTTCGDFLEQEDHKGGKATCAEKGKCAVCGYAYLEVTENHTPDTSKWVARGDMYHYHPCKLCGAHCDVDDHRWSPTYLYQDATGHAWVCADCKANSAIEKHNPGPAATDTTPQTCKDCGYIIAPEKNHKHDLIKVPQTPATCMEEGNMEYYFCTGCNDCFTDAEAKNKIPDTMSVKVGALGHTASDTWGIDETYHWRTCTTCKQVLDETKLLHDVTEGKCNTCNYVIGSGNTDPGTTPAETTPEPGHNTEQDSNTWIKILLVALACFAVAITATAIILKKKRR